jgi:uncharacterized protein YbjT (DUF2867 family)
LEGCEGAYYLVHSVASARDYPEREERSAEGFRRAAERAGLRRIVYLGGVEPQGVPSAHLRSRLRCGQVLRSGRVPTFELRAAMIIGSGSASWQMVHDLAQRLPLMVFPRWMGNHSWPVSIEDVVFALVAALALPAEQAGHYDVPGPERLSHRELLLRVAGLLGKHPAYLGVPLLSPRLSSYWIRLVSRVDLELARELVAGLESDLEPAAPTIWDVLPAHRRRTLEESVRFALGEEAAVPVPQRASVEESRAPMARH